MDPLKLPVSVLLALGLAGCGDKDDVGPCLSLSHSDDTDDTGAGPCLSPADDTAADAVAAPETARARGAVLERGVLAPDVAATLKDD